MELVYYASTLVSAVLFLGYGVLCLTANGMAAEFERFGLRRYRMLIGALEVLGAVGLVVGQWLPPVLVMSAGGLAVLMVLGVATRIRVGDSAVEMLPAGILGLMNLFIVLVAVGVLPV
jgi:hypothetical protein